MGGGSLEKRNWRERLEKGNSAPFMRDERE